MCGPGIRDNRRRCLGGAARSFLRLGVGIPSLGDLGCRANRWRSLGRSPRSFLRPRVGIHSLGGLGGRGNRWRSLGDAPRSFLHLGVGMHSLGGLCIRGSRWRSLGGARRSFHWSPRIRCVPTPRIKKLWSAPPRLRHRLPRTPGLSSVAPWDLNVILKSICYTY